MGNLKKKPLINIPKNRCIILDKEFLENRIKEYEKFVPNDINFNSQIHSVIIGAINELRFLLTQNTNYGKLTNNSKHNG